MPDLFAYNCCNLVAFLRPVLRCSTSHLLPFTAMDLNAQSSPWVLMPESADSGTNVTQVSALGLLWNCISRVQGSEQIHGLGGSWECVELPGGEVNADTSQDPHEDDDIPACLSETNDFRPLEPDEREKDVYGIIYATGKAHDRWLILATEAICFGDDPKAAQAYRDWARAYRLLPKLERQVLIHDIEVRYTFVSIDPSHTLVDIFC